MRERERMDKLTKSAGSTVDECYGESAKTRGQSDGT